MPSLRLAIAMMVTLGVVVNALTSVIPAAGARVLSVGPDKKYRTPSAAARDARDGDVIEIDAAIYDGDVAVWRQNNLVLRGVNGRPHLRANGAHAVGKGIWVIEGRNTTVENIEFSGARVPDRNGSGIRQNGVGLTVRNCYFHDNETGILGGSDDGEVVIEFTEFANNGHGDGHSHNIYITPVRRFTLRGSYSHHARIGHDVKSRARENHILYNRLMNEATGTGSYEIDLPNGGVAYVIGNLIQQGPHTDNATIVSYGAEGLKGPANELYVVNNTIVNDRPEGGRFVFVGGAPSPVRIVNNLFVGKGTVLTGPGELINNLTLRRDSLIDPARYDYRLRPGSPAINAGVDPGAANGMSLTPTAQYVHPTAGEPRPVAGRLDVGAYEYRSPNSR